MPKGKHTNHVKGANHHRWNKDRMLSSHGYVKVRLGKGHPLADRNGYAYEHLKVWVESGRPKPGRGFAIHHVNEDKTDNRIENLQMVSVHEHAAKHFPMLTDEQVCQIRTMYASGQADMPTLAVSFGVPISRIHRFITGASRLKAGGG